MFTFDPPIFWGFSVRDLLVVMIGLAGTGLGANALVDIYRGNPPLRGWPLILPLSYLPFMMSVTALEVLSRSTFRMESALCALLAVMGVTASGVAAMCVTYGPSLTMKWSKTWVKSLDFLYLGLAVWGLFRLVNSSVHIENRLEYVDTLGTVLLAGALGVRLAKSIIEVFFDRHIAPDYKPIERPPAVV